MDYCEDNIYEIETQNHTESMKYQNFKTNCFHVIISYSLYRKQYLYYQLDDAQSELDNERRNNEWKH
jgi:phosphodiesterase/alkaline phosphatase D-like protein